MIYKKELNYSGHPEKIQRNMRVASCSECGAEKRMRDCFSVNSRFLCEPCANVEVKRLRESKTPMEVLHVVDATLCALCGADGGEAEFALTAGAHFCPTCVSKIHNFPFPIWLKAGLGITLGLLLLALIHGAGYFQAEYALTHGERLLEAGQPAAAVPLLKTALQSVPTSQKCVLTLAKAQFLSGHPSEAYQTLNTVTNGVFKTTPLATEVVAIAKRVDTAGSYFKTFEGQYKQKEIEQARFTLIQAKHYYPEWGIWKDLERELDIDQAYTRKDYDAFAQLSALSWKAYPQSSHYTAAYASALACKYAVSGQESCRQEAEQLLEKARSLALTPAESAAYQEYAERIRYRLSSKEIIDKEEYDRRFRSGQPKNDKP